MATLPKENPARRNRPVSAATLPREHDVEMPELPMKVDSWHPMAVEFWADAWRSPMATKFEQADVHGLYIVVDLIDAYWREEAPRAKAVLAAEIRLQRLPYGLTPTDRVRLRWEIERADEAQDRGAKRRAKKEPQATDEPAVDPRTVLRLA